MVVILSDKSGKVFLCLLSALSFAFCQDCDIDDLICTNAVKFSQRAKVRIVNMQMSEWLQLSALSGQNVVVIVFVVINS